MQSPSVTGVPARLDICKILGDQLGHAYYGCAQYRDFNKGELTTFVSASSAQVTTGMHRETQGEACLTTAADSSR